MALRSACSRSGVLRAAAKGAKAQGLKKNAMKKKKKGDEEVRTKARAHSLTFWLGNVLVACL